MTLKGTPFLYNGEEIGMSDYQITNLDQIRDQLALFFYELATTVGGMPKEEALKLAGQNSRDKNRTPTQWANAANAGFSPAGVTTWLPVNPDYQEGVNVADQDQDPQSLLNFYRQMLRARRDNPALVYGAYQSLDDEAEKYLAFVRTISQQRCLVLLNMTAEQQQVSLKLPVKKVKLILSTHPREGEPQDLENLCLQPFEAYIAELD